MKPIFPMEPVRRDDVPEGDDWIAQIKWDGVRILTYYDGTEVRLFNRKCRERTYHYPEITSISTFCDAQSVILDGEVIALGPDGKPSFHTVMRRDGLRRLDRVEHVKNSVPITYMIFDVLYFNGQWVTDRPFIERLQILSSTIRQDKTIQLVSSHDDGRALYQVMEEHGMEGIVMKRRASQYLIGEKRDAWVKVKNYRDLIAVVGGFTQDDAGVANSILLGLYDETGQLWYIGHTGTGKLTRQEWKNVSDRLSALTVANRPFVNQPERHKDARWVQPLVTVKIQFAEWTEGRALRQPSIQAFVDVPPEDCVL